MVIHNNSGSRWLVHTRDRVAEDRLVRELGVSALVASILCQRGLSEPYEAQSFLHPQLSDLNSPEALPDYAAASAAILGAKERKELIYIHGDYDVDGVTSAAILSRFLTKIGCTVVAHVPHRMKEGYGIHESAVDAAKELGAKLFLTCDCGSGAIEQVAAAREAGMTVVVTDHHTIGPEAPNAHAFINPHRTDCDYPFKDLSGAGVAFKLCEGLTRDVGFKTEQFYRAYLDLAALGTIADVMPLVGENRIIAKFGLERLAETQKVGLQALKAVANVEATPANPLRAYHVGYVLGPRLNAVGRVDDASLALQLLLTTDQTEANELANKLEEVNRARRSEQDRIVEEAIASVLATGENEKNVIVVSGEGWHAGIVGIVAGRLTERFHRPTFVMSVDKEGICKGSARSIPEFHLADAIRLRPDLYLSGGGHAMAAGCSFREENLAEVRKSLHEHAQDVLPEGALVPTQEIDLEVDASEVTFQAVEELNQLEPFGCANPKPVMMCRNINVLQVLPTKNPAHARLSLRHNTGPVIQAIAFGLGEKFSQVGAGVVADIVFQPNIDEWKGVRTLKWQVKDFSPVAE